MDDVRKLGGRLIAPIHIMECYGTHSYEEYILWDLENTVLSPSVLASSIAQDNNLANSLHSRVLSSLQRQIASYKQPIILSEADIADDRARGLIEIPLSATLDGVRLHDTVLWDPYITMNSPEDFGTIMALDLGLPHRWGTVIACIIRQSVLFHLSAVEYQRPSPLKQVVPHSLYNQVDLKDVPILRSV